VSIDTGVPFTITVEMTGDARVDPIGSTNQAVESCSMALSLLKHGGRTTIQLSVRFTEAIVWEYPHQSMHITALRETGGETP
jgi:hypothetical protein